MTHATKHIAVLLEALISPYHYGIWQGIESCCKTYGYAVTALCGSALDHPNQLFAPRNAIYKLLEHQKHDGLITLSSSLSQFSGSERFSSFIDQFKEEHVVDIGVRLNPSHGWVHVNNRSGIRDLVRHLCGEHGFRNIAVLRGPETSNTHRERFIAYKEEIEAFGIAINPELVVYTDPNSIGGYQGIVELYDKRKQHPDAIIAFTDGIALRAIEALAERGIRVPQDVAVCGFNGRREGLFSNPPLTSVDERIFDQGYTACEILIEMIRGEAPRAALIESRLICRSSCSCQNNVDAHEIEQLDKLNTDELENLENRLIRLIVEIHENDEDPSLSPPQTAANTHHLATLYKEYTLICSMEQHKSMLGKIIAVIQQVGANLNSGYSLSLALQTIANYLSFHHACLIVFDNPATIGESWLRLVALVINGNEVQLPEEGRPQAPDVIFPPELMNSPEPKAYLMLPLRTSGDSFGYAIFESGFSEGVMYELLQNLFSSAMDAQEKDALIRDATMRFSDIAIRSDDWMFEVDEDLLFTYSSDGAKRISGFNLQYFTSKHLDSIFLYNAQKSGYFSLMIQQEGDRVKDFAGLEMRVQKQDGQFADIQISGRLLYDANNNFKGIRGVVKDISNQKQANLAIQNMNKSLEQRVGERTRELKNSLENLRQTQNQLIQSEKMAALGTLVAGVSHEINTPLGIALTASSYFESELNNTRRLLDDDKLTRHELKSFMEDAANSVEIILHSLERSIQLIRSLKESAVEQNIHDFRIFELEPYLSTIVKSLAVEIRKKGHSFQFHCEKNISLYGSPGIFFQLVSNMIMNSLLHAYPGNKKGNLELEVRQSIRPGNVGKIIINFSDDGCGMSREVIQHMYEPFFTTKRGQGGSGLGLNIVYNLVTQKLHGAIDCTSEINHGTTFTIEFPWLMDAPEESTS